MFDLATRSAFRIWIRNSVLSFDTLSKYSELFCDSCLKFKPYRMITRDHKTFAQHHLCTRVQVFVPILS